MLRRQFSLLLLLLLLWACGTGPTSLYARSTGPGRAPQEMNFTVEGKITRLAPNKITLSTEENMVFHVVYSDQTEIKNKDGPSATAKDLRVGLRVRVDGDLTESGEIIARRIEIQQAPGEKKPSSVFGHTPPASDALEDLR
jgi:hypothetical protein